MIASEDYPNLDFLRSCAVLFVCGSHLIQFFGVSYFWGGRLSVERMGLWGVMIFFVHTCLVLMLSLERQKGLKDGRSLFPTFMIRRCFRIYPLSILVVGVVSVFHLPLATLTTGSGFLAAAPTPTHWTIFCNVALIQNLAHRGSILGPLWSLPLEIQMYLLLPGIFLLTMPPRAVVRIGVLWFLAFVLAATVLRRHLEINDFVLFVPCFLPGVIAYRLLAKKRLQLPAFLWPLAIAGLTIFTIFEAKEHWLKYWMGTLILGLAIPIFSQLSNRWLVEASRIIARYSYGIYLTHFFSIWLAFQHLSRLLMPAKLAVFLVSFVGLPVLLYHSVEQPGIRLGKKLADQLGKQSYQPSVAIAHS